MKLFILVRVVDVEPGLGAHGAGDGGEGKAKDAQDGGELVGTGRGVKGFDETAGEDADEGDLFDEGLGAGGIEAGEVALVDAASIEAVLEGVEVSDRGTGGTGGRRRRHGGLPFWRSN